MPDSPAPTTPSPSLKSLAAALAKCQSELRNAKKDAANPFFNSSYADLSMVWDTAREPLTKNGLSVMQLPSAEGARVTVETILLHASGESISSRLTMTAKDAGPQSIGSAITYARRYALSAMVGIASEEDDDGNAATHAGPPPARPNFANGPKAAPKATKAPEKPAAPANKAPEMDGEKDWRNVVVHFGKESGNTLGSLPDDKLQWFAEKWTPKPWPEGTRSFNASDLILRKALDEAAAQLGWVTPPPA